MNNFTKLNTAQSTNDREKNEAEFVEKCLTKAESITESSPQKDICNLMAEIANYQIYNAFFFKDILAYLLQLLSSCITSKCNCTSYGFIKLHNYISTEKAVLKNLKFI